MKLVLGALVLVSLVGCAAPGPGVVHPYEAQRLSTIGDATVLSVRPVTIDGYQSGVGAGVGAVTGSVIAANAASYHNSGWAGLLGFVVGGVVGNAVERSATTQNGVELLLQMRNGERRSIIQANGNEGWMVGEPVVLVTTAGRTRVTRAPQPGQPSQFYPSPAGAAQPVPVYPQSGAVPAYPQSAPVPEYPQSGPVPPRS
jgi:outer membrane lipoprotein SlyB